DLQKRCAALIAVGIERVAETGDLLATAETRRKCVARSLRRTRLAEQRLDALGVSAVLASLERRETRGHHFPWGRRRRGHAARGEGGDVQLVVGAEDERGAE